MAHDLAPLFERLLGVKEEVRDEEFLAVLGRSGLGGGVKRRGRVFRQGGRRGVAMWRGIRRRNRRRESERRRSGFLRLP